MNNTNKQSNFTGSSNGTKYQCSDCIYNLVYDEDTNGYLCTDCGKIFYSEEDYA